jgi:hypothetical protein
VDRGGRLPVHEGGVQGTVVGRRSLVVCLGFAEISRAWVEICDGSSIDGGVLVRRVGVALDRSGS